MGKVFVFYKERVFLERNLDSWGIPTSFNAIGLGAVLTGTEREDVFVLIHFPTGDAVEVFIENILFNKIRIFSKEEVFATESIPEKVKFEIKKAFEVVSEAK